MSKKELDNKLPKQEEGEQSPPSYEELKTQLSQAVEKARIKSGRSVEDIAYQINIPVPNLVGMENGSAYDTMEKVFVRGYMINYAKALELDSSGFVELLNQVYIARNQDDNQSHKNQNEAKKPVQAYGLRDLEKGNEFSIMKIIPPILITLVIIGGGFYWQLSSPPAVSPSIDIKEQEFDQFESPYVDEYQNTTEYEDVGENSNDNSNLNTIAFTFLEESWLEVIDSQGKKLAWQLFGPGQSATFTGEPPYSVVVGNARGTLVNFNGIKVDLNKFADAEDVARLTLPIN